MLTLRFWATKEKDDEREWQPVVRSGMFVPLQMRKWVAGKWVYRDPTAQEIEDYIANEAW